MKDHQRLCKDNTDAPYIETLIIIFLGEDDFWWTVESAADMIAESLFVQGRLLSFRNVSGSYAFIKLSCCLFSTPKLLITHFLVWLVTFKKNITRLAKVTELDLAGFIDKDIGRLDISVHDVGRVHEVQGTEQIIKYNFHVCIIKLI